MAEDSASTAAPPVQAPAAGPPAVAPAKRKRRRHLVIQLALLAIILALLLAGLHAIRLWRRVPQYWAPARARAAAIEPAVRQTSAVSLERRLLRELTDPHAPPRRTVRLTLDEINAWLSEQLPAWAANRGAAIPPGVQDITALVDEGRLILAFLYDTDEMTQVITAVFVIDPPPAGAADAPPRMRLRRVLAGELPIPAWALPRHAAKTSRSPQAELRSWTAGLVEGIPLGPWPIDARRELRIDRVDLHPDYIDLHVCTDPRPR